MTTDDQCKRAYRLSVDWYMKNPAPGEGDLDRLSRCHDRALDLLVDEVEKLADAICSWGFVSGGTVHVVFLSSKLDRGLPDNYQAYLSAETGGLMHFSYKKIE